MLHLQQLKGMQSSKQGVYVKGVTFVNRRYTKGVPFLSTIARILQPYNILQYIFLFRSTFTWTIKLNLLLK